MIRAPNLLMAALEKFFWVQPSFVFIGPGELDGSDTLERGQARLLNCPAGPGII